MTVEVQSHDLPDETILARYDQIPARAGAAANLLRLADDPNTSAQDLARAAATDPLFAARLLRVANSTYYGLSGRVSTLPFAVSVVGFQVVRTYAVIAAAGLDGDDSAPEGFWEVAAVCATAAEQVAPLVGANPGDAFCVGLLHTLGAALLHRDYAGEITLCVPEPADAAGVVAAERERMGVSHDLLAAGVLRSWQFPEHVVSVVGRHHKQVLPDAQPLERALHLARSLADTLLREDPEDSGEATLSWLSEGRITPADVPALLEQVSERSTTLLEGLRPRG